MKIKKDELTGLEPAKQAHLYALIAWNGKTFDEAKNIVIEKNLNELQELTYANDSISQARDGIKKHIEGLESKNPYPTIIEILSEIHDKWVEGNAKKYNRDEKNDNPAKIDKRLFQHLPAEYIGIAELSKDMIFLKPYLDMVNINIGSMSKDSFGEFSPSEAIKIAYQDFTQKKLSNLNIKEITPDAVNIIIDNYEALHKTKDEQNINRLNYMKARTELLSKQIQNQNPELAQDNLQEIR